MDVEVIEPNIKGNNDAADENLRDQIYWILRIKYFMIQQILKQINNCSLNKVSAIIKDHNSKEVQNY